MGECDASVHSFLQPWTGGLRVIVAWVVLTLALLPGGLLGQDCAVQCEVVLPKPGFVSPSQYVTFQASQTHDGNCCTITCDWDFGDGRHAGQWTSDHHYSQPGTYNWILSVWDSCYTTAPRCQKTGTVTVVPGTCQVTCTAEVTAVNQETRTVQFHATGSYSECGSGGPYPMYYKWEWGDGTSSEATTSADGVHTYAESGKYYWTLYAKMGSANSYVWCSRTGSVQVGCNGIQVGSIKICASTMVSPVPPSTKYLFEGDVTVNDLLYLPGVVSFEGNPQNGYGTLSAPGGIQVKTNHGTEFLLQADSTNSFEVSGSEGKLQPNWGTNPRQLGIDFMGVPVALAGTSITLIEGTGRGVYCEPTCLIGIEGAATLAKVKIKMLFPPGAGVLFQGTDVLLGQLTPNITLAQANFTYDAFQDKLEGTLKLALPAILGNLNLEGNIRVLSGCIDGGGITLPVPEIPLGTTGLATKDGTFEFAGRCTPPTSLFFGGSLKFLKIPDQLFTIDHVGLKWQLGESDWFDVDGGTAMFLGYPQANVRGRMSVSNPRLWIVGKMNVAEVLQGDTDIQLVLDSLRGSGTGDLALRINDFTCSDTSRICRSIRALIRSLTTLPYTAANVNMDVKIRWDILQTPPLGYMDFKGMVHLGPVSLAGAVEVDKYGPHVLIGSNYDDMWSVWGALGSPTARIDSVERALEVPAGQERVVFSAQGEGAVPSIALRTPAGETITPANSGSFPGVTYFADEEGTVALFRVEAPTAGSWTLTEDNLPQNQVEFIALGIVPPPTTAFTSVTQNGDAVSIAASVTPPAATTRVDLFFSGAADGSIEGVIAEDLDATGGSVSTTWDTSGVPSGTYHILAKTEDGKNPPVKTLYSGSIAVDHGWILPPFNLSGTRSPAGDSAELTWTPSATPGVGAVVVRFTDEPRVPGYPQLLSTIPEGPVTVAGMDPAKGYRFCLQAVDGEGNTSPESNAVTFPEPGSTPGDCDGDGSVSIGEVQKAINMFLGTMSPSCGVDCSGDGTVSIGEVQKVINGFLGLSSSC